MKKIPLTKGKFALVDDENFEELSKYKWYYLYTKKCEYAARRETVGGKQKTFYMHHTVVPKPPKGLDIDHIDDNGLNNQKNNLRVLLHKQNIHKQPGQLARSGKPTTSKYKGVSLFTTYPRNKPWMVRVGWRDTRGSYRQKNFGYFATEKEAALAYNKAAREILGGFAYQNLI